MSKQIADALIEHVKYVMDNFGGGKIKNALLSKESFDPSIRGDCTRIFSTPGEKFKISIANAKPVLETMSGSLLQDLRGIQLTISEETIKKLDSIVNSQLKVLKENPSCSCRDFKRRTRHSSNTPTTIMAYFIRLLQIKKRQTAIL